MKIILIALSSLFFLTAVGQTKITAEKAAKEILENTNIQLVDVRTEGEFKTKHLQDAENIDWKDQVNFETKVSELDKSKPVYIYCLSGGRSALAAKKLAALGYEVYDIEGGIVKWEADNLPLAELEESPKSTGMTRKEYNDIIQNNDIVLIDFHATWCPPCQKLAPIIADIQKKYEGKVTVVKIDVDANSQLSKSLGITSIPTLIIYKKGTKTWTANGFVKQKTIEKQL